MKPVKPSILPKTDQPQGASVRKSENRLAIGICVLLALAVFAVFGQTLRHGFVNFDDDLYVYQNPVVLKGLTFQGVSYVFTHQMCDYYHPLTMLSLMLDNQVYRLNAGGYHLTNVLLHAATTILLFLVLRRMTGTRTDKSSGAAATQASALWPSAFVAAVFAIHPLRVESVAWVTERKDVLSGLFFVLTLGAYVRYARTSFSLVRYLTVILPFALGLLSKPSLVTLPFLLLLLDYWPFGRMQPAIARSSSKILRPLIIEKIPLFMLSAASCVATVLTQQHVMATVGELPLLPRMGYAAVSYVVYLGQMFHPAGLAVVYPFPQKGLPLPDVVPALTLLAGISAGVLALRKRRPYLVVGWLWYLGMLMPMIGLVHVGSVARADRFTYLAQIGVYIMMAWTVMDLTVSRRHGRRMLGVGAFSVIVVLMVCAWKQTSHWRNSESLWNHTLACTSDNSFAYNNLGNALLDRGNVDEAIVDCQKALQIKPHFAEACNSLGSALLRKGRVEEAIAYYQRALQIKPDFAGAYNNLGNALLEKGNVDEAIVDCQKALQIKPDFAEACFSLGSALLQKGSVDEAIAYYEKALQIKPDFAEACNNLGNALLQKGSVDEAIARYQQALQINPDYAQACYNLGSALLQKGRVDEAIAYYQKALQIKPYSAEAYNNLGSALFQKDRVDEAIAHYQKALQINPDYAQARYNLGIALLQKGRVDEAITCFQRALQINPNYAEACYSLGSALLQKGRVSEAITHLQQALQIKPDYVEAQNNLAWLLATCQQASLRNGNKAAELAQRANQLTDGGNPVVLGTLAAAYAESGRFPEAVEAAQRALRLAEMQSNTALADAIRSQMKFYQAGIPFHSN